MKLLQGKGLVEPLAGEYHTVEYAQGRVQQQTRSVAQLMLPDHLSDYDEGERTEVE